MGCEGGTQLPHFTQLLHFSILSISPPVLPILNALPIYYLFLTLLLLLSYLLYFPSDSPLFIPLPPFFYSLFLYFSSEPVLLPSLTTPHSSIHLFQKSFAYVIHLLILLTTSFVLLSILLFLL